MPLGKVFSLFFLLLFLGTKSLSYHPLAHLADEDQMNCELCEATVLQLYIPLTPVSELETLEIEFLIGNSLEHIQHGELHSSYKDNFYCRPPPSS